MNSFYIQVHGLRKLKKLMPCKKWPQAGISCARRRLIFFAQMACALRARLSRPNRESQRAAVWWGFHGFSAEVGIQAFQL